MDDFEDALLEKRKQKSALTPKITTKTTKRGNNSDFSVRAAARGYGTFIALGGEK